MEKDKTKASIWKELDGAITEYTVAKDAFDEVRVKFEVAKRRLEITKELASESMSSWEWEQWLRDHKSVSLAGLAVGDAILTLLEWNTKDSISKELENGVPDEGFSRPVLMLEQIRQGLVRGGFEFRSLTPAARNQCSTDQQGRNHRVGRRLVLLVRGGV
ncbi:MAG: hypothetical protein IIC88_04355 [Chloroflexi bacterium]|nr:hypothetical protein [Chloroflexota bacterium]